jgi:hypothetical protein
MRRWLLAALSFTMATPAVAERQPETDGKSHGLYVLAINGGGDKLDNFASHLGHLRQLVELLSAAGIPRDHITVLSSDGQDPAPDLATRDADLQGSWLLQGTRLDPILRDLTVYENSVLSGITLRPATGANLQKAVSELGARLHAGDTLLVYVTDHGTQDRRDPLGNSITLWGRRESISVRKLGGLLRRLPSQVRVVSLMSQCFSGGFALLHEPRERRRQPNGHTCGYFSSTPDRPAYGCYPEVRGQKGIGHSFEFLSALARRGRFPAAHADVLVSDDTPDIPLRSSDVYLAEVLARAAGRPSHESAFVEPFLRQAFVDPSLAGELQQVDRLAAVYGVEKPASLDSLEKQANTLFDLLDQVEADAKIWEAALADFNQGNLDAFLKAHPDWRPRLDERALRALDANARRALATSLLSELEQFALPDPARAAEANRLLDGLNTVDEVSYRNEIRVAALMRMRFVLTTAAGRVFVRNKKKQNEGLEALDRCEDLSLPIKETPTRMAEPAPAGKLATVAEDRARAEAARPGWLGLSYVPVGSGRRKKLALPSGAAQVTSIAAHSPASTAGLRTGDILVGAPNHPFIHKNDLRPFIVSAKPGSPLPLDILRGPKRIVLTPTVAPVP